MDLVNAGGSQQHDPTCTADRAFATVASANLGRRPWMSEHYLLCIMSGGLGGHQFRGQMRGKTVQREKA